ncbi:hypothetical protein EOA75_01260 [Mesorhizobium sp. M1A.F.Ca.IN.022.07.1.1]|uniref:hypothetical protein n=1 Tax=Mesorhizobium sp. M1A.F.Ca.IN.022.07.1.1 TaxID=2496767 RepID=UPI000FC9EFA3|nr:hypothetical protein [Mesorhizobium sp. M1A.F.Ca.IN.022.07.1.1]RUV98193.1 hypothetical protein EOA75_01260 [Mesorhizobium sp. M1A.F.Ca.IN.022.07.1.1]
MRIFTSSWFTKLPPEIQKIGVSRGTPRGYPAGFRKMPELAPGEWFKTASEREYKQLYFEGLDRLNPGRIVAKMEDLSGGRDVARGGAGQWLRASTGRILFLSSPLVTKSVTN